MPSPLLKLAGWHPADTPFWSARLAVIPNANLTHGWDHEKSGLFFLMTFSFLFQFSFLVFGSVRHPCWAAGSRALKIVPRLVAAVLWTRGSQSRLGYLALCVFGAETCVCVCMRGNDFLGTSVLWYSSSPNKMDRSHLTNAFWRAGEIPLCVPCLLCKHEDLNW